MNKQERKKERKKEDSESGKRFLITFFLIKDFKANCWCSFFHFCFYFLLLFPMTFQSVDFPMFNKCRKVLVHWIIQLSLMLVKSLDLTLTNLVRDFLWLREIWYSGNLLVADFARRYYQFVCVCVRVLTCTIVLKDFFQLSDNEI